MPIPDVTDLDQDVTPLMWAQPNSREDARNGRYCTSTGYWAPGRCIVYVDSAPYIKEFAPSCSAESAAKKIAQFKANLTNPGPVTLVEDL